MSMNGKVWLSPSAYRPAQRSRMCRIRGDALMQAFVDREVAAHKADAIHQSVNLKR
jgi:hypothetical protein